MAKLPDIIQDISGLNKKILLVLTGIIFFYFNCINPRKSIVINIFITCFILIIFDLFIKDNIKVYISDNYYNLIINNTIVILVLDLLFFIFRSNYDYLNFTYFFNVAFASIFYETIIYKLYNYNSLCNSRLRTISKITLRLGTIHILSNFLSNKEFDETWFNFSFSQLFNIILFEILFNENQFYS
jgi:hypothetical protein